MSLDVVNAGLLSQVASFQAIEIKSTTRAIINSLIFRDVRLVLSKIILLIHIRKVLC